MRPKYPRVTQTGNPNPPTTQPCLLVLSGPEQGALFPLQPGLNILGRSAAHSAIVVSGRGVSRAHASLQVNEDATVAVTDLGSTNGVFVNGTQVTTALLRDRDTLALGPELVMRLEFPDEVVQQLLDQMYARATKDALTGLLNRRSFLQRLHEEHAAVSRHREPAGIALVDIDNFRQFNEAHGYPAGDQVIVEISKRLLAGVREEDVVGRLGGEEFVLLIRHTDSEGSMILLDRLRESISDVPIQISVEGTRQEVQVTVSGGVAVLRGSESGDQSLQRADQALYQAKREGRNRVILAP